MDVNVDESRCDDKSGSVDDAAGLIACQVGGNSHDLVVANGHIGNPVQMVLWIDDLSATHDQVVVLLARSAPEKLRLIANNAQARTAARSVRRHELARVKMLERKDCIVPRAIGSLRCVRFLELRRD